MLAPAQFTAALKAGQPAGALGAVGTSARPERAQFRQRRAGLEVVGAVQADHRGRQRGAVAEGAFDAAQEDQRAGRFALAGHRRGQAFAADAVGELVAVEQVAAGAVVQQHQAELAGAQVVLQPREVGPVDGAGQHQRVTRDVELHRARRSGEGAKERGKQLANHERS
jgi:hypothetical protein